MITVFNHRGAHLLQKLSPVRTLISVDDPACHEMDVKKGASAPRTHLINPLAILQEYHNVPKVHSLMAFRTNLSVITVWQLPW
jgi:hypothetical protein